MTRHFLTTTALVLLAGAAQANCPAMTLADDQGIAPGAFPQQYDLAEYESAAGCTMEFSENPEIADLNAAIQGNPDLPPLAERLPSEPANLQRYSGPSTSTEVQLHSPLGNFPFTRARTSSTSVSVS